MTDGTVAEMLDCTRLQYYAHTQAPFELQSPLEEYQVPYLLDKFPNYNRAFLL
jgi:hypothetical protein